MVTSFVFLVTISLGLPINSVFEIFSLFCHQVLKTVIGFICYRINQNLEMPLLLEAVRQN